MDDCIRDSKNKRMCELIKLPNTNKKWICTECKSQFIKQGEGSDFDGVWILLILCLLFFAFLLNGCINRKIPVELNTPLELYEMQEELRQRGYPPDDINGNINPI